MDKGMSIDYQTASPLKTLFIMEMHLMTKEVRLTERQQRVLDYIRDRIENRGYGPTVREIGDEFDIRSPNGVACHLKALEKKGLIAREANRSRAIQLTRLAKPPKGVQFRGQLIDGKFKESPDAEKTLDLESILEVRKAGTFVVQIKGLTPVDGISDGDFVILRKTSNAGTGQIVLVKTESGLTMRQLHQDIVGKPAQVDTVAAGASYDKPQKVVGVVLGVVRPI